MCAEAIKNLKVGSCLYFILIVMHTTLLKESSIF